MHFGRVRIVFRPLDRAPPTLVRVGRSADGWAAVAADGSLLALAPNRRATLAMLGRLRLVRQPGRPFAIRRAVARGTPFQLRIWRACRRLPKGRAITYGELARRAGVGSPRAVGQALGSNPLCRLIPCHRIVARSGPGGFAWGQSLKDRWLRSERG